MKNIYLTMLLLISYVASAQSGDRLDRTIEVVCYSRPENMGTRIFRDDYNSTLKFLKSSSNLGNVTNQSARIEVTYIGFSPEAKLAFQRAVDIWADLITSPVTIYLEATWGALAEGTLGSASWNTAFRNFDGAQEFNTWYPVALAEKMAGEDLNEIGDADIVANFNSSANWYLGLDGNPSAGQFDFVSIVLHEIGHGLGFADSYRYTEGFGLYGIQNFPFIFDLGLETASGGKVIDIENNSLELGFTLTSDDIFFFSPSAIAADGIRPKLYAPVQWSNGSSIAHLDESTYPAGDANSLMTPQIGANEVMHKPGPITLNMFKDMGWEFTYIDHVELSNTDDIEAEGYTVVASINSDIGFDEDSVMLYYSIDGFLNDTTKVKMMKTGNLNEFSGQILSKKKAGQVYTYFLRSIDNKERIFNRPSLPSILKFDFTTDVDETPPVVLHSPQNFIKTTDASLKIEAIVQDFLPLQSVNVEYYVNDQAIQVEQLELVNERDSFYSIEIPIAEFNLQAGDSIRYRIVASDGARNSNQSIFPMDELLKLSVVELADPVTFYFSDFDNLETAAEDFFESEHFSFKEEINFLSGALHSTHPYSNGTGINNESDYIIEMRIPIIVNPSNSIISFDEVVLVEPGEAGAIFGDSDFWDFVIVEASNDGGNNWLPLIDGYDSRSNSQWLGTYNSILVDNNSQALGNEGLFRRRVINILQSGNFLANDQILIRFRLHADEAAYGWGWAIDNLNIQVDEEPPLIFHNHFDYITSNSPLEFSVIATDNVEIERVQVIMSINDDEQDTLDLNPANLNQYSRSIDFTNLKVGDIVKYRIVAFDSAQPESNASFLPSSSTFFEVPFIQFETPQESYSNDFNEDTNDFVGNIFSILQPESFPNGAIYSSYPLAFGINNKSTFTYTLKVPIAVSPSQPFISYNEVVLVEPFSDFVAVEASKDNGESWFEIIRYSSNSDPNLWQLNFQLGASPSSSFFKERLIKITDTPQLSEGDEFILRFRMERSSTRMGFGWVIDDLEIQTDVITGLENNNASTHLQIYPNPVRDGLLRIKFTEYPIGKMEASIYNLNGQVLIETQKLSLNDENVLTIDSNDLPSGIYLLKLVHGNTTSVHKIWKID
uniref:T9SS type A sorting domain-containing protein n=2 Tax=Roseivirga sp. TaxID=1964215 RepID=UPI004048C50B